jgi:hypothetical protein
MDDTKNQPPVAKLLSPNGPSPLLRLDRFFKFGFSVLDRRIFGYAFGTCICGLGAGAIIGRWADYRVVVLDLNGIISLGAVIAGTIIANIAHGSLMREAISRDAAEQAKEPTHAADAPSETGGEQ